MLGLHCEKAVTVPCPLCGDMMSELDELMKHMMSHRGQYVQIWTDLIADDISTLASETSSTSKSHNDVPRIRSGVPTILTDREAAYKSLTQHDVSRTSPLIWPSNFKGPETSAQLPPSFKFSPPAKIRIPESSSSASGRTQIAHSDPKSSSPVLFRLSSPHKSSFASDS